MSGYPPLLEPCRRRLPTTPTRRSSSPRILPTPPPASPEFPPASALERRPSGRKLPLPPSVPETEWSFPSPVVRRKFSDMPESLGSIAPSFAHQRCSFDQAIATPSSTTTAPSQTSSQSPSIEQLTSKSSSDNDERTVHGIDVSLYQRGISVSSTYIPENNPLVVPTSSSWTECETRPIGLGLIYLSIQHFPVRKRLRVSILKAEGLAGQLKPELEIHAYCKINLLPGGKSQTSIIRRGRDVVFNQEFFFDGVLSDNLNEKCLNISVCHQFSQKLQKDAIIGELFLPIKNLIELRNKKEIKIVEELKHHSNTKKLGKIHISSCIEKEARRLTINVIKVEDLPKGGITGPPGKILIFSTDMICYVELEFKEMNETKILCRINEY